MKGKSLYRMKDNWGHTTQRGTVQHEIMRSNRATAFVGEVFTFEIDEMHICMGLHRSFAVSREFRLTVFIKQVIMTIKYV